MKFIHISDTHLLSNRQGHYASDPAYKLERAVESINKYQNDADFVVITGDLTDKGELLAYQDLKKILSKLIVPYDLIIGNHDHRANYLKIFKDKFNCDTFAHYKKIINSSMFLFLDTKKGDWHNGGLCESRFSWLQNNLDENKNLPTYLFMHHPPCDIYHKHMDIIGFEPKDRFWEIIKQHKNVKHIFFGHVHLLTSGTYEQVGYSATRSTNHQVALLAKNENLYFNSNEQPTYSIVNINSNQVNCTTHEYLNEENTYSSFIPMDEEHAN